MAVVCAHFIIILTPYFITISNYQQACNSQIDSKI